MNSKGIFLIIALTLFTKLHAQTVHEVLFSVSDNYHGQCNASAKFESGHYLVQYTTRRTDTIPNIELQNHIFKYDRNWLLIDSIVIPDVILQSMSVFNEKVYAYGFSGGIPHRKACLYQLDSNLNIVKVDTLNGSTQDMFVSRIKPISNGVELLAWDVSEFKSSIIEVPDASSNIQRKEFTQNGRTLFAVEDYIYFPEKHKYVFVGQYLSQDTLKVGSDRILNIGIANEHLEADTIGFMAFYPTNGTQLKRATVVFERSPEMIKTSDSTFIVAGHGKDYPNIFSDWYLSTQLSVSSWDWNLNLINHQMYGRQDTMDAMISSGFSYNANDVLLGFVSHKFNSSGTSNNEAEIGLMKFNRTGIKIQEDYIMRTNMRYSPTHVKSYTDTEIVICGYYKDLSLNKPQGSRDGFLIKLNPDGIANSISNVHLREFKVYPNPSGGKFYFESELSISLLEIYDSYGRRIKSVFDNMVDLSEMPIGIYFYRATLADKSLRVGKLFKN